MAQANLCQSLSKGISSCLLHTQPSVSWPFADALGLGLACAYSGSNLTQASQAPIDEEKLWQELSLRMTCVAVQDGAITDLILANQAQLCDVRLTASAAAALTTFAAATWKDTPSTQRIRSSQDLHRLIESMQIMIFSLKARAKGAPLHTLVHFHAQPRSTQPAGTPAAPLSSPRQLSATLADLEGCDAAALNQALSQLASSSTHSRQVGAPAGVSPVMWSLLLPLLEAAGTVLVTEEPEARKKPGEALSKVARLQHDLEMHKARAELMASRLEGQALTIRQLEQDKHQLMESVVELQALLAHSAASELTPCTHRPSYTIGTALLGRQTSSGLSSCGPATPPLQGGLQPAASVASTHSLCSVGQASWRHRSASTQDVCEGGEQQTSQGLSRAPSTACTFNTCEPQPSMFMKAGKEQADELASGLDTASTVMCRSTHSTQGSDFSSTSGCQAWEQQTDGELMRHSSGRCSAHQGLDCLDSGSAQGRSGPVSLTGLAGQAIKSRMDWLSAVSLSRDDASTTESGSSSSSTCGCKAELVACKLQLELCRQRLTSALAVAPDINLELIKDELELLREECSASAVELAIHRAQVARLTTQLYESSSSNVMTQWQAQHSLMSAGNSSSSDTPACAQAPTLQLPPTPGRSASPEPASLTVTSHVKAPVQPAVIRTAFGSPSKHKPPGTRPAGAGAVTAAAQHANAAEIARKVAELPRKPALPKFNLVCNSSDGRKQPAPATTATAGAAAVKAAVYRQASRAVAMLDKIVPAGGSNRTKGGPCAPLRSAVSTQLPASDDSDAGEATTPSGARPAAVHVFHMAKACAAHKVHSTAGVDATAARAALAAQQAGDDDEDDLMYELRLPPLQLPA